MRLIREMPLMFGLGLVAAVPGWAQSALSAGGFTGWSVTPSANIQAWGTVSLAYDNQLVGGPNTSRYGTSGDNLVVGFGIFPNLEISGRIASSTLNTNCFTSNCGIRDLSASFKAGAPLDRDGLWHIAAGATDIGGQTSTFRSLYGVLTYSPAPYDLSLGYARPPATARVSTGSPLDGVFGSAAYKPLSWLQTHVEYVDSKSWVGARVFAPAEWLPSGWAAFIGLNARVTGDERGSARSWVSAGVTIPLYRVSDAPSARSAPSSASISTEGAASRAMPPSDRTAFNAGGDASLPAGASTSPPAGPSAEPLVPVTDEQLRGLAEALRTKGFEDISVGRTPDGAVAVRVNNASYNVNSVDGLGAALGVIARALAAGRAGYRLVLTQRQIAIVGVTGQADCLADWIGRGPVRCTAGQLYTPGTTALDALLAGAEWVVQGRAPSWTTPRLMLQPVLRNALATEYGVLDYSLAVRATLQQPLWAGAWVEVGGNIPVQNSDDYQPGKVFGPSRFTGQTDRYMVHQMFRVPLERLLGGAGAGGASAWGATALTAHVAAGRIDANYRGTFGELRWEPAEGRYRVGLEGGRFERNDGFVAGLPLKSRTLLANYRYTYTPTRTYFEATAGQFLYNDRGARFAVTQWFDDVAVSLYVRRTKFEWQTRALTSAGIEVSLPLTPRKDMSPASFPVQVTGTPLWSYGIETVIRNSSNAISTNQGVGSNVQMLDRTFNFDRSGLVYFEDNMTRIRNAARP